MTLSNTNSNYAGAGEPRLPWEPPAIIDYGAEKPAMTHFCSYASGHLDQSTCRLAESTPEDKDEDGR